MDVAYTNTVLQLLLWLIHVMQRLWSKWHRSSNTTSFQVLNDLLVLLGHQLSSYAVESNSGQASSFLLDLPPQFLGC